MEGSESSKLLENQLTELTEELRSALTFAYVAKKLRKAGICTKDVAGDCLYYANRDIRDCIHKLAEYYNEPYIEDKIFGVGFVSDSPKSETETIFSKVWNDVVQEIDHKWKTA
ncbi:hypothetical protein [Bacillus andreraoultii]|uniref:hypothetical protein n=1 Tax=Bacillus andreraoultii TaxID=1499685 RepID=UPI00053A0AAC|nr:hypothetical protein [Bacillus andreraoultii]